MNFNTPILFLIFKRPEQTQRVFDQIKKIKPSQLFVVADGPRNIGEKALCDHTRNIIKIDWPCELKTIFRKENFGCRKSCTSAIKWFFSEVEQGIILEDDCLPNTSFFYFCQDLLNYYKDNTKIMHISGNFFHHKPIGKESYYFSHIPHIWGWATWKRAWDKFEIDLNNGSKSLFDFEKDKKIELIFNKKIEQKEWIKMLRLAFNNKGDAWDFEWTFTIFKNNGLCINPNINLVSNIGSGQNTTHEQNKKFSNIPISEIKNPLDHPLKIEADQAADEFINKNNFGITYTRILAKNILKKLGLLKIAKKIKNLI